MPYDPEYDGRMVAATRNIAALFEAVNHFERERAAVAQRLEQMMGTVTMLVTDNAALKQEVAALKAQVRNAGIN